MVTRAAGLGQTGRPRTPDRYDARTQEAQIGALERELGNKHDRRGHMLMEPGKRIGLFTESSNQGYLFGLNSSGTLSLIDIETGAEVTFLLDWGNVNGAAEEIVNLRAEFQAADATLTASVTSVATVSTANEASIASLTTEITAARDGEANLAAKVSSIDTAIADEASARATSIQQVAVAYQAADATLQNDIDTRATVTELTTAIATEGSARAAAIAQVEADYQAGDAGLQTDINTRATTTELNAAIATEQGARATAIGEVRAESQRTNLLPETYHLFDKADGVPLFPIRASIGGTSVLNPFTKTVAEKIVSDGTDSFFRLMFGVSATDYNITLPPGRYGLRLGYRIQTSAPVTDLQARLVGASGNTSYVSATPTVGSDAEAVFVIDTTSETDAQWVLDLRLEMSSAAAGWGFWPHRLQIEALPDGVTEPGDWAGAGATAYVREIKEAVTAGDSSKARLLFEVDTGTNAATIEATSQSGDGTWNGSAIKLTADEITLDGDAINLGSATVFETTHNTFHTTENGYRYRDRGPFGSSDDLLTWFGPTSVVLNSETKTNGIWAIGTDGKLYYGADELGGGAPTASVAITGDPSDQRLGAGSRTCGPLTAAATGLSGAVSWQWRVLAGDFTPTSATTATCSFTTTVANGEAKVGLVEAIGIDSGGDFARKSISVSAAETS